MMLFAVTVLSLFTVEAVVPETDDTSAGADNKIANNAMRIIESVFFINAYRPFMLLDNYSQLYVSIQE